MVLLCLLAWVCAGQARPALAGYGIHPNSETTSGQPTFTVYLSSDELPTAVVYIASDSQMDSNYFPTHELASCSSFAPTDTPNAYTCQPSWYFSTSSSVLTPGTYYWWLTFWHTDPVTFAVTEEISGPLQFTVAAPQAPAGAALNSPVDGAVVSTTPTLSVHAPANSQLTLWVADSSDVGSDGSPANFDQEAHCSGTVATEGDYTCTIGAYLLTPGNTYYWWAVITVGDYFWVYGPRYFTVESSSDASPGGSSGSTGGSSPSAAAHNVTYAPYLRSSEHFVGKSVKQVRLSRAAYALSKILGVPKSVRVACWSTLDWENISGDNPESYYSVFGFFWPAMPHWIQLSPRICHTMETLIYHRPRYSNRITANAVDTLTHEMIHALGVRSEARTECYAMQLTYFTARALGVPAFYAENLGRLTKANYFAHPPSYINVSSCREGGSWDLFPAQPSLPWHMP